MTFQNRPYQKDAIEAGFASLIKGNNPVISLVTGGGKSVVICGLADEILSHDPKGGVLRNNSTECKSFRALFFRI